MSGNAPPPRLYPLWVALCDSNGCLWAPVVPLWRPTPDGVSVSLLCDLIRRQWLPNAGWLSVLAPGGLTGRSLGCGVLIAPLVTCERWPVVVRTSASNCPQCGANEWCAARSAQLDWWARRPKVTRWQASQGPGARLLPSSDVPPWPNSHYKAD